MTFNASLYTGKSGCYAAAMVDPLFNPWIAMIRAALGLADDIDMNRTRPSSTRKRRC